MNKQLTTKVDKAFLGRLCADAISNLERACEKHPTFPAQVSGCSLVVVENMLRHARQINDEENSAKTACMIAHEEELEMEVAIQSGYNRAAYDELVDLITVWLRVGCHLKDYVSRKCVNGNCSIKATCGRYHQAANTFEASGANGLYDQHGCRKGKCDHFVGKGVQSC